VLPLLLPRHGFWFAGPLSPGAHSFNHSATFREGSGSFKAPPQLQRLASMPITAGAWLLIEAVLLQHEVAYSQLISGLRMYMMQLQNIWMAANQQSKAALLQEELV
jgi:hypothetical protein